MGELDKLFENLESTDVFVSEKANEELQKKVETGTDLKKIILYYLENRSERALNLLIQVREPNDTILLDAIEKMLHHHSLVDHLLVLLSQITNHALDWIPKIPDHPIFLTILSKLDRFSREEGEKISICIAGAMFLCQLIPQCGVFKGAILHKMCRSFIKMCQLIYRLRQDIPIGLDLSKVPVSIEVDITHAGHLAFAIRELFQAIYGIYPQNFIHYIRHYLLCTKENQLCVFLDVIKPMMMGVRLHPNLVSMSVEGELSRDRWIKREPHDFMNDGMDLAIGTIPPLSIPTILHQLDRETLEEEGWLAMMNANIGIEDGYDFDKDGNTWNQILKISEDVVTDDIMESQEMEGPLIRNDNRLVITPPTYSRHSETSFAESVVDTLTTFRNMLHFGDVPENEPGNDQITLEVGCIIIMAERIIQLNNGSISSAEEAVDFDRGKKPKMSKQVTINVPGEDTVTLTNPGTECPSVVEPIREAIRRRSSTRESLKVTELFKNYDPNNPNTFNMDNIGVSEQHDVEVCAPSTSKLNELEETPVFSTPYAEPTEAWDSDTSGSFTTGHFFSKGFSKWESRPEEKPEEKPETSTTQRRLSQYTAELNALQRFISSRMALPDVSQVDVTKAKKAPGLKRSWGLPENDQKVDRAREVLANPPGPSKQPQPENESSSSYSETSEDDEELDEKELRRKTIRKINKKIAKVNKHEFDERRFQDSSEDETLETTINMHLNELTETIEDMVETPEGLFFSNPIIRNISSAETKKYPPQFEDKTDEEKNRIIRARARSKAKMRKKKKQRTVRFQESPDGSSLENNHLKKKKKRPTVDLQEKYPILSSIFDDNYDSIYRAYGKRMEEVNNYRRISYIQKSKEFHDTLVLLGLSDRLPGRIFDDMSHITTGLTVEKQRDLLRARLNLVNHHLLYERSCRILHATRNRRLFARLKQQITNQAELANLRTTNFHLNQEKNLVVNAKIMMMQKHHEREVDFSRRAILWKKSLEDADREMKAARSEVAELRTRFEVMSDHVEGLHFDAISANHALRIKEQEFDKLQAVLDSVTEPEYTQAEVISLRENIEEVMKENESLREFAIEVEKRTRKEVERVKKNFAISQDTTRLYEVTLEGYREKIQVLEDTIKEDKKMMKQILSGVKRADNSRKSERTFFIERYENLERLLTRYQYEAHKLSRYIKVPIQETTEQNASDAISDSYLVEDVFGTRSEERQQELLDNGMTQLESLLTKFVDVYPILKEVKFASDEEVEDEEKEDDRGEGTSESNHEGIWVTEKSVAKPTDEPSTSRIEEEQENKEKEFTELEKLILNYKQPKEHHESDEVPKDPTPSEFDSECNRDEDEKGVD